MIRLSAERITALTACLPANTLAFLADTGAPDLVVFRGIEFLFTLDLEPLLKGEAYRLGTVDRGWYSMALRRTTGHFGFVFTESRQPPWVFCNSSIECFLQCVAASERLWRLEDEKLIESDSRGAWLEREIRVIDPVVFKDENNAWSFLVEELRNGVV